MFFMIVLIHKPVENSIKRKSAIFVRGEIAVKDIQDLPEKKSPFRSATEGAKNLVELNGIEPSAS